MVVSAIASHAHHPSRVFWLRRAPKIALLATLAGALAASSGTRPAAAAGDEPDRTDPRAAEVPEALRGVDLLALAPEADRAVLRRASGERILVAEGDVLGDLRVQEVLAGRLVLEGPAPPRGARRLWWLEPPTRPGLPSRLRLLDPEAPATEPRDLRPGWIPVEGGSDKPLSTIDPETLTVVPWTPSPAEPAPPAGSGAGKS